MLAGEKTSITDSGYHEVAYRLSLEAETIGYLMLSACRDGDHDCEATRQTWIHLAARGAKISWSLWSSHWQAPPTSLMNPDSAPYRALIAVSGITATCPPATGANANAGT